RTRRCIPLLATRLLNHHSSVIEAHENVVAALLNLSISACEALMCTPGILDALVTALCLLSLLPPSTSPQPLTASSPSKHTTSSLEGVVEDAMVMITQVARCDESMEAFWRVDDVSCLVDMVVGGVLLNLVKSNEDKVVGDVREVDGAEQTMRASGQ
ncbi:hypothetical protein BHM03_00045518, partial [Ensete ventricosum]